MKMKMKFKQAVLAIAIYTMTVNVFAASDGTISATSSTATLDVSMQVLDMIQITSDDASDAAFTFADATITSLDGDDSNDGTNVVRSGAEEFCVFVNGGGGYQLTISDSNSAVTSGIFNLASTTSGVTDNIPFQVTYTAAGKDASQAKLTARGTNAADGTLVTGFAGYAARFCDGNNNLAIWVDLLENDMLDADTAEYSTTLSFLVAVE